MSKHPGKFSFLGVFAAGVLAVPALAPAQIGVSLGADAVTKPLDAEIPVILDTNGVPTSDLTGVIEYGNVPIPNLMVNGELLFDSFAPAPGWSFSVGPTDNAVAKEISFTLTSMMPVTTNNVTIGTITFDTTLTEAQSYPVTWTSASSTAAAMVSPQDSGSVAITDPQCRYQVVDPTAPGTNVFQIAAPPGGGLVPTFGINTETGCSALVVLDAAGVNTAPGMAYAGSDPDSYPFDPPITTGDMDSAAAGDVWVNSVAPGVVGMAGDPIFDFGSYEQFDTTIPGGTGFQSGVPLDIVSFQYPPAAIGDNAIGTFTGDTLATLQVQPNNTAMTRSVFLRIGLTNGPGVAPPTLTDPLVFVDDVVEIIQDPCDFTMAVDPDAQDFLCKDGAGDIDPMALPAADDTITFGASLDASCEWVITQIPEWMVIRVTDGDGILSPNNMTGDPAVLESTDVSAANPFYGLGPATIEVFIDENNGEARQGQILFGWFGNVPTNEMEANALINGVPSGGTYTAQQQNGCGIVAYTPPSATGANEIPAAGADDQMVTVELTGLTCVPTFTSPAPWITDIQVGVPFDMGGQFFVDVTYDVAPNNGGARSTTLDPAISGPTTFPSGDPVPGPLQDTCVVLPVFNIDQECGCEITFTPDISTIDELGGPLSFDVTDGGCEWTIESNDPWITIDTVGGVAYGTPATLYGTAAPATTTVDLTIDPNAGNAPRTGSLTILPEGGGCGTFNYIVCQEGTCDVEVFPEDVVVPSTFTQGSFDIIAPPPPDQEFIQIGPNAGGVIPDDAGGGDVGTELVRTARNVEEGLILDLTVELEMSHDFIGNTKVSLMHLDSGTIVELVDEINSPDPLSGGCDSDGLDVILEDEASVSIENSCVGDGSVITGRFQPVTPLARFDGLNMQGEWAIIVVDTATGTQGTLDSWTLYFDYQPLGCQWEIIGPLTDGMGMPLNGNGLPDWFEITNIEPDGMGRYTGIGSQRVDYNILPTDEETVRELELLIVPFLSGGGPCAALLLEEPAVINFRQWADCLYTLSEKKTDNVPADPTGIDYTFTIQTNEVDPLNGCTWRFDDIPSWVTITEVFYPNLPLNPAVMGDPIDPNQRANPVLFGEPGYPADADNFQGEGTAEVTFNVDPNLVPGTEREGHIQIGTETGLLKHLVCQIPDPCTYEVDDGVAPAPGVFQGINQDTRTIPNTAGAYDFELTTPDGCCWNLVENEDWITLTSLPQGTGSSTVSFTVPSNLGPARTGYINVFDCDGNIVARYEVVQEAGCDLAIDSFISTFECEDPFGGDQIDSFDVILAGGCLWNAVSNDGWVTIVGDTSGDGRSTVTFSVAPNVGPARQTTITVTSGGQVVNHIIKQASGCVVSTSDPTEYSVPAAGQVIDIDVDGVTATCPYEAVVALDPATNRPYEWIEITSGATGTVVGAVEVTIAPNAGPARSGSIFLMAAKNVIEIVFEQDNGCVLNDYPGSPDSSFGQAGGTDQFTVSFVAGAEGEEEGCLWTAASDNPDWITIVEGNDGVGTDLVVYEVAPYYLGGTRNGSITVTGPNGTVTYEVEQTDNCAPVANAPAASYNHSAQSGFFALSGMSGGCPWTATVNYVSGGAGWLSLQTGQEGVGNGLITYEVATYQTGMADRVAEIIVTAENGLTATHTITQSPDCDILDPIPASGSFDHDGGTANFQVVFAAGSTEDCIWNISVSEPWINVQDTLSGTGSGFIAYEVEPYYGGGSRMGTITISLPNGDSAVYTVTQTDECAPVITETTASYDHSTQSGSFSLTGMDDNCPWSASISYTGSETGWLSLQTGQDGVGDGLFTYEIQPFFTAPTSATTREAVITVTGTNGEVATHTVTQTADCMLDSLNPDSATFNHDGGSGNFSVIFADGSTEDCIWTIEVSDAWINVQDALSGVGNGNISYEVEPYFATPVKGVPLDFTRTGTITVVLPNGELLVHEITQIDECEPLVTEEAVTYNHSAQPGVFTVGGMDEGCPWSVSISYDPPLNGDPAWVSLQTSQDGVGNGIFGYEVSDYQIPVSFTGETPDPRSATITVTARNGRSDTHVITQLADCDLLPLEPASQTFNHEGGSGNFAVTFAAGGTLDCAWDIVVNAPVDDGANPNDPTQAWINVLDTFNGIGDGQVSYEVLPWYGDGSRVGTITVVLPNGDQETHTVTQTNDCDPTILPETADLNHSAQSGQFTLSGMFNSCPWTIEVEYSEPGNDWLTLTSGNDGVGDQLITYVVDQFVFENFEGPAPTPPASRTATIRVVSDNNDLIATHVVTQSDDCDLIALEPSSADYLQGGGAGSFEVLFADGSTNDCNWVVTVDAPRTDEGTSWISIQSGIDGVGNGLVTYEVLPFFNSGPDNFSRTGTITVTLPNGDTLTHTVNQNDNCVATIDPETICADQAGGCFTFDVNFGTDPDGEYNCPWIARVRYDEDDPAFSNPDEQWVFINEGSTEGSGNGSVTYCVDEYHDFENPSRTAFIDIILDNGRVVTFTVCQIDECEFEVDPDVFTFDHQGRLTGPVVDQNLDNTGTAFFEVLFEDQFAECGWKAQVLSTDLEPIPAGEQWISIVEGSEGTGNGQVFFEVDPNVVAGPDVPRSAVILVTGENGQTEVVMIDQSEGFYMLDQFELGMPPSDDSFAFGMNNLVIGYTSLSTPTVNTLQPGADNPGVDSFFGQQPYFVAYDDRNERVFVGRPDIDVDANGNALGIMDVEVWGEASGLSQVAKGEGPSSPTVQLIAAYELPVTGRFTYRRTANAEVTQPDNNFNGYRVTKYNNRFTLRGNDRFRGSFNARGIERYDVVPPESNIPAGFSTRVNFNSRLDGAAGRARADSNVMGWNPTPANLAISKSSLQTNDPRLRRWTSDLLILDSDFTELGQQGRGDTKLTLNLIRQGDGGRTGRFGSYNWSGTLGKNRMRATGILQLTEENASEEGFLFERDPGFQFDPVDLPAPPETNPGAIRGVTVFPENIIFTNPQVRLRTKQRWDDNLVDNGFVTSPPSNPADN